MKSRSEYSYRIGLAKGFLSEAEQDFDLKRWRSCVDNSQLAVENSAKAILALFEIPPKTHEPAKHLANLVKAGRLPRPIAENVTQLLPDIISLGLEEHFMTDYGDEATQTLPWDLFTAQSGSEAIESARRCVEGAKQIGELKTKSI